VAETTRAHAPGSLRLVEELVNTLDIETGVDRLDDRQRLDAWLAEQGFAGGSESERDVERATGAREGLRALLAANAGLPLDEVAVERLNRALAQLDMSIRVGAAGAELRCPGNGLDALLAAIAQAIVETTADGSWGRLKACRSEDCRWAFYDRSKNRSGAWCTMAVCGSRTKVRAYRSRHAPAAKGRADG
jgi:predicted RNA-binding Zn ribbon-like protein